VEARAGPQALSPADAVGGAVGGTRKPSARASQPVWPPAPHTSLHHPPPAPDTAMPTLNNRRQIRGNHRLPARLAPLERQSSGQSGAGPGLGPEPVGSATAGILSLADAKACTTRRPTGSTRPDKQGARHSEGRAVVRGVTVAACSRGDKQQADLAELRTSSGDLKWRREPAGARAPGFDLAKMTDLGE